MMATRSHNNSTQLLAPTELIERWRGSVTASTLTTWRSRKLGPPYVKVGGRVLYPLSDVEAWEQRRRLNATPAK